MRSVNDTLLHYFTGKKIMVVIVFFFFWDNGRDCYLYNCIKSFFPHGNMNDLFLFLQLWITICVTYTKIIIHRRIFHSSFPKPILRASNLYVGLYIMTGATYVSLFFLFNEWGNLLSFLKNLVEWTTNNQKTKLRSLYG